ncbi:N-acyl homoserine lactonase family protein [Sphingorhabdus soli]|uniref:N-acyl homoserine lactonase family protein n=1 Tax=Flavisphingopyxis soli TaxID=2601267 RepID=A0A5C6UQZ0_9SPHN|nr:N-acyl homoserine lactonase family protein [Sphingorhabdus soli]TXC73288.1 N-acyl homoserine lactonase family protein [Sphingorhabdus soli]
MTRLPLTLTFLAILAACSQSAPTDARANEAGKTADAAESVTLARLDCGTIEVSDLSVFSVAGSYKGVHKTLTDSCYLIRHGDQLMLWDTGLPGDLAGKGPQHDAGWTMELARSLVDQLADLGIKPADIDIVGISHFHNDHTGQLAMFPNAKLLTGKGDWDAITAAQPDAGLNVAPYAHWAKDGGSVEPVSGDHDVFGDGSVVMLDLPGHTPGHTGLKVVTPGKTYLLTGDVAHFHANYDADDVPTWNTDKAASVESLKRFKGIAEEAGATVVIQHDPADIGLVPAARASAK